MSDGIDSFKATVHMNVEEKARTIEPNARIKVLHRLSKMANRKYMIIEDLQVLLFLAIEDNNQ